MAQRKAIPFIVGSQLSNFSRKKNKRSKPAIRRRPLFTIEDAFSDACLIAPEEQDAEALNVNLGLERGLRSVSFLLHSISDHGTKEVAGAVADGLGHILEQYAGEIARRALRNPDPAKGDVQ